MNNLDYGIQKVRLLMLFLKRTDLILNIFLALVLAGNSGLTFEFKENEDNAESVLLVYYAE